MRFFHIPLFALAQLWFVHPLTSKANPVTYEALPELISSLNKSVGSSQKRIEASKKRTGHLMRSYLPSLRISGGYERNRTEQLNFESDPYGAIELKLNVLRSGKDSLEEDMRTADLKRMKAEKISEFSQILREARELFWTIAYHEELTTILKAALDENQTATEAADRRIKRGLTTKTDRLEFELRKIELETQIESLQHENLILKIAFAKLIGRESPPDLIIPETIPHSHDEELLFSRPETSENSSVVKQVATSEILRAKSEQLSRWWAPSIDLYASYTLHTIGERAFTNIRDRDEVAFGVLLTMNLFDGFQSSRESSSMKLKFDAANDRAQYERQRIRSEYDMTKEEMKHAHDLIHKSEEKIEKGEIYLRNTMREYNNGVKNSLDVLSALRRHVSFLVEYTGVKRDYQISKARLFQISEREY